jgi:hypothetical protein
VSIVIPVERLWELYDYSPLTGDLISKTTGKPLKPSVVNGYWRISVKYNGQKLNRFCHRVIFAWCAGYWPSQFIDHINRNPLDNRINNLREATPRQNQFNTKRFNKGASWHKRVQRWGASIFVDGRKVSLGYFDTKEEAQKAYTEALAAIE